MIFCPECGEKVEYLTDKKCTKCNDDMILNSDLSIDTELKIKGDIKGHKKRYNLSINGDLEAKDITVDKLEAKNINANNIIASTINAKNINADSITVRFIYADNIQTDTINAREATVYSIGAKNNNIWKINYKTDKKDENCTLCKKPISSHKVKYGCLVCG